MTEKGLFCEAGGFYVDPHRAVDVALVTHAHSDHARKGSKQYYSHRKSVGLLQHRLGPKARITGVEYREALHFGPEGEVKVTFHPAGHILGSAQIRIEHQDRVWVFSGDYKREPDPTCEPFEVVPCDTFITEATFGNPSYDWGERDVGAEIMEWWEENRRRGKNSLLFCYAVGKTQRVLAELAKRTDRRALLFGEANDHTQCYRDEGVSMIPTLDLERLDPQEEIRGELILAPQSICRTPWIERLGYPSTAFASGWMLTGAHGVHRRFDKGFVLSDHADWKGLVRTVEETGASQVFIFASSDGSLARHLRKQGIEAWPVDKVSERAALRPVQMNLF